MTAPNDPHSDHRIDLTSDTLPDGTALGFASSFIALWPGQTIGRYKVISVLGCGVLGPTYRALDPDVGRDVVIKEFLPSVLAVRSNGIDVVPRSPEMADEFTHLREHFFSQGRKLIALKRAPFVARVLELVEANGTSYIVQDLIPGISLEHRLLGGRMGAPAVDRLMQPLLEGLQYVHEAGVFHGDIRPANILLGVSDRPTLVDFGATRATLPAHFLPVRSFSTSGYAPPEQASPDEQSAASDLYSLAATIYRAIIGTAPPDAIDRLRDDTFKPLTGIAPAGFDRDFLAAIDKGLALRLVDRPQSIATWRKMLWPHGVPRVLARPSTNLPADLPPLRERLWDFLYERKRTLWLGAVSLLVALGGGLYFMLAQRSAAPPVAMATAASPAKVVAPASEHAETERDDFQAKTLERDRTAENALLKSVEDELRRTDLANRKAQADAIAADTKRRAELEKSILKKLDADAEAKRQAEVKAEADRQAAAADAQRQAAAKAEADRQAAAAAEAQRLADAKAEADREAAAADAKPPGDATGQASATAETGETALQLLPIDRQHLQVALRGLGFDPGNVDGSFGPQTRQAVAAWQDKHHATPTGFLTADQKQALLEDGSIAIGKFDALQDPKGAEAREKALQLSPLDRQHVQAALTALGFDTGGTDSMFGLRSRQMIAAWQDKRDDAATGFLTADQIKALFKEGAAAISRFDDTSPDGAGAREAALKLSDLDRQHVQVALTALGFDTLSTDGALGQRARQMIGAWQTSRGAPPTGFLTATQKQALLAQASMSIARFDEAQKKVGANPTPPASTVAAAPDTLPPPKAPARAQAMLAPPSGAMPDVASTPPAKAADAPPWKIPNKFDGAYTGTVSIAEGTASLFTRVVGGEGTGSWSIGKCRPVTYILSIDPVGDAARIDINGYTPDCDAAISEHHAGRIENNQVTIGFSSPVYGAAGLALTRQGR